jgi:hypothetical protein
MTFADLLDMMDYNRQKTLGLLDTVAKQQNAPVMLGWRPGPGRAHIAWQLMHIAATDDRHLHVRVQQAQPQEPRYVERFAGGSVPDDDIPPVADIRRYLQAQREGLVAYVRTLGDGLLATKPHEQMPWTYRDWLKTLAWHEAHHQGQAHLTLNLYRAAHPLSS